MALEVGNIVLCTVDRIIGTNVFVKLDNTNEEGVIVFSEIAPGRIRNIRDYVFPQKKIVCKILRLSNGRIELSLRRVSLKEQKELKEGLKLEKSFEGILKGILKEKSQDVIRKILEKGTLNDFFENSKENSKELEKITGKEEAKKILDAVNSQKRQKKVTIKKEVSLTTSDSNGIAQIKKIFQDIKGVNVKYISAGKYVLISESEDAKKADNELALVLEGMEKEAKKLGMEFSIVKK